MWGFVESVGGAVGNVAQTGTKFVTDVGTGVVNTAGSGVNAVGNVAQGAGRIVTGDVAGGFEQVRNTEIEAKIKTDFGGVSANVSRNGVGASANVGISAEGSWRQLSNGADLIHAVEDCERDIARKVGANPRDFDVFRELNIVVTALSGGVDLPQLLRQLPIETGGVKVFFKVSGSASVGLGITLKVGKVEQLGHLGKVKVYGGSGKIPLVGGKGYFGYEAERSFQGKDQCVYIQTSASAGTMSATIEFVIAYNNRGDVPDELADVSREVKRIAETVNRMRF